jgi:hypothetical protein
MTLSSYSPDSRIGFTWLRIETSGGEHGNEPSGSIKYWEILE